MQSGMSGEESEVPMCEIDDCVEDGGTGAGEAGCAEDGEDGGAEEVVVEGGGVDGGGHGRCGWGLLARLARVGMGGVDCFDCHGR